MRAFCTVSAPLEVCAPPSRPPLPPLPANARFLALRLFGTPQSRTLYFLVEAKSRVREVYAQTCHHFSKQGMLDTELFGLAVLIDGEYLFADPESKLSKYGPKSWRSSHTHGLDANGKPLLELHFRVQFYIESPLMLRDEITRHHYYLQLKTNAVGREIPKDCSDQSLLLLGGLSLQADLGDCPEDSSSSNSAATTSSADYFRADDYIPSTLRTTWGISALHSCHRENRGMSRADAETHFIREACGLHEAINAHIFRMKSNKSENGVGSVMLIIYAKGLKIVNETSPPVTFLWPSISKLSFDRKKFELRSGENKITLYSGNDDKNKMLLALCRETHQFSMKIAPRLTEAMKREEEESNCIHACYLYSRALNMQYKSKNDQRISVISSTSSNTTSGIVSDRVHSEDELEILINTPPIAAPSTESLALAHLLDCPSVSRQTSSVGQVSLKDIGDTFAALSIRSNTRSTSSEGTETLKERTSEKDCDVSPSSQHNVGSQCSSTCSTVVVVNSQQSHNSESGGSSRSSGRRQLSTCSSLELGFSHTAQNSAISESTSNENHHYGTTNTQNDDEETISGVYALDNNAPTETSGVYTMNSSELTGESSEIAESESHESSHYGSFHPNSEMGDKLVVNINIDSVDGDFRQRLDSEDSRFRMRSDSNISAAGSFRGDGSDPTDKKHNPLTAEELTDLIVGRGTYPSRKTVSDTMDSDCDYVTLPIPLEGESYLQGSEDTAPTEDEYEKDLLEVTPPAPPQRIDSMSLSNIVEMPQPPPYNAHHETTGLRGPDITSAEIPSIPMRESQVYPRKSLRSLSTVIPPSTIPEETPARFITTRPHINILKAHTTLVGESAKPSYAAPTVNTINNLSQSPLPTATSLGIPIVPYHNLHATHKTHLSHTHSASAPRTCVLLPVIKPRTQSYVPPPMQTHRQPPPPPPTQTQLATVYTSQLARSQIELYQQQLYSDVDYVIYPLQDPAVSQQEYLDSKQGSILAAMAQSQPPPYLAYHTIRAHNRSWDGNHALYRSTPFLSMAISSPSRYASTQNLSDTYVQLPGTYSPLYSPSVASLCSSYEPPPPLPPLRPPRITQRAASTLSTPTSLFSRSRSDDNILNSIDDTQQSRRRPIPIPPAYEKKPIRKPPMPAPIESCLELSSTPPSVPAKPSTLKTSSSSSSMKLQSKSSTNLTTCVDSPKMATSTSPSTTTTPTKPFDLKLSHVICPESNKIIAPISLQQQLDISILREKSRNLDLPLISALCNDRSLLKQTKAFVMPKQQRASLQNSSTLSSISSKSKYPVSGLNTTQLSSTTKSRKTTISHRHPNDKLPPLPVSNNGGVNKNNYVMDPIPLKQKTNQQNTNL